MSFIPLPNPISVTDDPPGSTPFRRFSQNPTLGVTLATADTSASTTLNFRTTATTVQIRSTSASDTSAGVGARSVRVIGLNALFVPYSEVVALAGTSVVTTTGSFIRVTSIELATSGTYAGLPGVTPPTGANVGVITANYTGTAAVIATMAIQAGIEYNSFFTVPAGMHAGLRLVSIVIDAGKTCDLRIYARQGANVVTAPFGPTALVSVRAGLAGSSLVEYNPAIILAEYTDVFCMAATSSGSGDVSLTLTGYFAPNP